MKLDILAFGAHPDDVELSCSGLLLVEKANGKKIGVIDLTEGELGSRGSVSSRYEEAANASQILGLDVRENLKLEDGFFKNDKESQIKIIIVRYMGAFENGMVKSIHRKIHFVIHAFIAYRHYTINRRFN